MKHHLALDYLLVKDGGFCKIVGSGCKVMYQDMNKSIEHHLGNLQDLIRE